MRYLTLHQLEISAISSDAKTISANYLEHPLFSFGSALCCALHYVFIKYVPGVSYSKGYELRSAIKVFLEFRDTHNSRLHPSLHLNSIEDLGVEQFRLFVDSLKRARKSLGSALRIRSALLKIAMHHDDGLPLLALPGVRIDSEKPREPLSDVADEGFYASMRSEVDEIRRKLEFREEVRAAKPYSSEEVKSAIRTLMHEPSGDEARPFQLNPARALRTLFEAGYPFEISQEAYKSILINRKLTRWVKQITEPSDFVLSFCLPFFYPVLRNRTPDALSYFELMSLYYPTSHNQASLALFIQRQSGWNKETVIAIDKENFVHPLSEVANSDVVMIVSEKRKSQSARKNYESPKLIWAISSRSNKYSIFNLIELSKELSDPLAALVDSSDRIPGDDAKRTSVFLCLTDKIHDWAIKDNGRDVRVKSLDTQSYWNRGVSSFLRKHQLVDHGVLLASAGDLEGRLRVTWVYSNAKRKKYPLSLRALQLGHESIETTTVHYDSSVMAVKDQKARFRTIQEDLIQGFRNDKFNGVLGSASRVKPKDATFRIFTIVGNERALWACTDSSKPDYPGSSKLARHEKCTRLDKCMFCSRVYILGDSLPFIMERLSTLQRAVESNENLLIQYKDEIEILEYILRNWGDESAIADALVYLRRATALLPFDMRSLVAYLED